MFIGLIKILPVFFILGIAVEMPSTWYICLTIAIIISMFYILARFSDKKTKRNTFIATGVLVLILIFSTISIPEILGLYFYYLQIIILKDSLGEIRFISSYIEYLNQNPIYKRVRLFFLNPKKKAFPVVTLIILGIVLLMLYHILFGSIYDMMLPNNDSILKHLFWMLVIFIVLILYFLIAWPLLEIFAEERKKDNSFLALFTLICFFISIQMTNGQMNFIKEFLEF